LFEDPALAVIRTNPHAYDFGKFMSERNSHPAALIQKEVIANDRHALVIYGDNHVFRHELAFVDVTNDKNVEVDNDLSLVTLLERAGIRVFNIKAYTSRWRGHFDPSG
jgi:hypothetical protein